MSQRVRLQKKILIVHPDRRLSLLLCLRFQRRGYAAAVAYHEEGFRRHVLEERPDLILLGMDLGERSGAEVYDWLATMGLDNTIPVIYLSGLRENRPVQPARLGRQFSLYKRPFDSRAITRDAEVLLRA